MAHQPNKQWRSWNSFFLFLPIGHFGCAPVRHCKLLFAIRSRSNLSICYKLPQILKLPQISRCSCIFARCDISLHCTSYLFVPPTTFARRQNCFLLAAKIEQKLDKNWTKNWQKLNKNLTKFGRPLAIQCSGDHEIKLSKVSQLIITENVRSMQKVRICRISFCCKIRCYFCRNSMPVDGVDAFQSLFICFRNQNLICLQFNHKRSCKLNV